MKQKIEKTLNNLSKRGFQCYFFSTSSEAKSHLLNQIKKEETIGIGGSMTVKKLEIYESLVEQGNEVYWHWMAEPKDRPKIFPKAQYSDIYLTSTNALTEEGELINIDGNGNRVSSMFFGPKKVIFLCGVNKIVKDENEGFKRIKEIACPLNAKRLDLKTPCGVTGECNDCTHPDRMCNITVTLTGRPKLIEQEIYLIDEELGY